MQDTIFGIVHGTHLIGITMVILIGTTIDITHFSTIIPTDIIPMEFIVPIGSQILAQEFAQFLRHAPI